jgi:hypothetical protein
MLLTVSLSVDAPWVSLFEGTVKLAPLNAFFFDNCAKVIIQSALPFILSWQPNPS